MKNKIVFASGNANKVQEIRKMMPDTYVLKGLADIECFDDIPETADTLEGNALIKAEYVYNKYGLDCFADDTGLEVEVLNGAPGVYSARYAGPNCNAEDNMDKLLAELIGKENRKARFRTVIAYMKKGQVSYFEGIVEGLIAYQRMGEKGFGYDPIFIPNGHQVSFAQMTMAEKNAISHRGKAIRAFIGSL